MIANFTVPEPLEFLLYPMRYKVARGGRGSSKSWTFARTLLMLGISNKLRILCAREIQKSIDDSVYKLLVDQITLMDITGQYIIKRDQILGRNGTEFTFTGLSDLTVDTIKSFEGYDICWIEEAQTITKRSWDILIPTIRKEGSEIWVSFNPALESDMTYQRFIVNPPEDCISVEINWRDNPWFNTVLNKERLHCKKTQPDDYDNIWEGKCRPAVEGAIYYKRIQEAEAQGRVCNVPYNPMLQVHLVLDLGLEDALGAACVQVRANEIAIIEYVECNHTRLDIWSAEMRRRPYNWGRIWLPHDGFTKTLKSNGQSEYAILKALGWQVAEDYEIVRAPVETGIRDANIAFSRMYFDKTKVCAEAAPEAGNSLYGQPVQGFNATPLNWRMWEALKRYRRHVVKQSGAATTPIKDQTNHAADVLRYIALNVSQMDNAGHPRFIPDPSTRYTPYDAEVGL